MQLRDRRAYHAQFVQYVANEVIVWDIRQIQST